MSFVYKDITVEQRAQIGLLVVLGQGTYGLITDLARNLGTSRKFVYTLGERVRGAVTEAVMPRPPGPTARPNHIVVDKSRVDRAILTLGLVGHAAQRPIADCLKEIYEVKPSLGYINGLFSRASNAATSFNQGLPLTIKNAQVEADELFALDKPHLLAVQHQSLLILAFRQADHCDIPSWREELDKLEQRGVELGCLASDGGTALQGAMKERPKVEHRLDLWHALRHISRAKRILEQAAYKAIGKEWELEKKAGRMEPTSIMGTTYRHLYEEARGKADGQIHLYDQFCTLALWAREALEAIDLLSGRIRGRQQCMDELKLVTELMHALKGEAARKIADYLDTAGPALLGYAEELSARIDELNEELGEDGVRRICREWQLKRELSRVRGVKREEVRVAYERAHMIALLHWGKEYDIARSRILKAMEGVMRGSSLAECVNSWLRPYAELMKGIKERFLPLFMLYRNGHVFQRGKRAGHSPLELAGVEKTAGDWLDCLGLNKQQLPLRTVRSLPKVA